MSKKPLLYAKKVTPLDFNEAFMQHFEDPYVHRFICFFPHPPTASQVFNLLFEQRNKVDIWFLTEDSTQGRFLGLAIRSHLSALHDIYIDWKSAFNEEHIKDALQMLIHYVFSHFKETDTLWTHLSLPPSEAMSEILEKMCFFLSHRTVNTILLPAKSYVFQRSIYQLMYEKDKPYNGYLLND